MSRIYNKRRGWKASAAIRSANESARSAGSLAMSRSFPSVEALYRFAADTTGDYVGDGYSADALRSNILTPGYEASWYGGSFAHKGLSGLASEAAAGFPSVMPMLTKASIALDAAEPPRTTRTFRRVRHESDVGDDFQVGRYLEADFGRLWESRRRSQDANGRPMAVRVAVNLSASCGSSGGSLVWRGVAAVALCDRLEQAGVRCRVDAFYQAAPFFAGDDRPGFLSICAKDYDDRVDVARLAAVACPSTLRMGCFTAQCCFGHKAQSGRGIPIHGAPLVPDESGAPTVLIDDCYSLEQAVQAVTEALNEHLGD